MLMIQKELLEWHGVGQHFTGDYQEQLLVNFNGRERPSDKYTALCKH